MATTYRLDGDVAVVTIDRPDKFNAIDLDTSRSLIGHVGRAGDEARALVLTGEGRAFSSGVDLFSLKEEYDRGEPDLAGTIRDVFNPIIEALHAARVPTICAVNGAAAGAGMGIALCQRLLAERQVAAGALLSPFGPELELASPYCLAYAHAKAKRPQLQALIAWLRAQMPPE